MNRYESELESRKASGLHRTLAHVSGGIDLLSNDYLGLARSSSEGQASSGSTGSRLLSGNSTEAEALEGRIADFHDAGSALIFSSGFNANLGLLSCLLKRNDTYILDELAHASLIDGARLSAAKRLKFKHNDLRDLEKKLAQTTGHVIVVVESVYSMNGDIAPLQAIADLVESHDAQLIVDEAHSLGLYGEKGEGYCQSIGVHKRVLARVLTFGKALGVGGAAVVGETWLSDYLVNFSRPFVYSTAPPPQQFAAIGSAYEKLPELSGERSRLNELISYFSSKMPTLDGVQWSRSETMIRSCIIAGNERVLAAAKAVQDAGINVLPIRSPTVAVGSERLRICLHAYNTEKEIDLLFKTLSNWNRNGSS